MLWAVEAVSKWSWKWRFLCSADVWRLGWGCRLWKLARTTVSARSFREYWSSWLEASFYPSNVSFSLKGAPIAKFRFSTFEFGVETIFIGFVILENPGSGGRNFRIDPYLEVTAKLTFWRGAFWWTIFDLWRLNFIIKFLLVTSLGTQGTILWLKILEINKSGFLMIFFPGIFNFFFQFFYGFFKFSAGSTPAKAIWVMNLNSLGSFCIRTSPKSWWPR